MLTLAGALSGAAAHQDDASRPARRAVAADVSEPSGAVVFAVVAAAAAEPSPPLLPPPPPPIVWPGSGPLTGWFGERRATHRHNGIDLQGRTGAKVAAAAAGTVAHAGPAPAGYAGYGTMVLIDHGGGIRTLYAHLSRVVVRRGQVVAPGEQIGAVGATGQVDAPHLHFELRRNGVPRDPRRWLPPR